MKIKVGVIILLSMLFSVYAYAQEPAPVQTQKKAGRTEIVLPASGKIYPEPTTAFGKGFRSFETGFMNGARWVTGSVGNMADKTVLGVQKASSVVVAPFIKTLDVRRWFHKKQSSSRGQH